MRKVAIAFAATIALLVAGVLAWNAQAAPSMAKRCAPWNAPLTASVGKISAIGPLLGDERRQASLWNRMAF